MTSTHTDVYTAQEGFFPAVMAKLRLYADRRAARRALAALLDEDLRPIPADAWDGQASEPLRHARSLVAGGSFRGRGFLPCELIAESTTDRDDFDLARVPYVSASKDSDLSCDSIASGRPPIEDEATAERFKRELLGTPDEPRRGRLIDSSDRANVDYITWADRYVLSNSDGSHRFAAVRRWHLNRGEPWPTRVRLLTFSATREAGAYLARHVILLTSGPRLARGVGTMSDGAHQWNGGEDAAAFVRLGGALRSFDAGDMPTDNGDRTGLALLAPHGTEAAALIEEAAGADDRLQRPASVPVFKAALTATTED